MRRLLVFQVLILFICAVVYTPALSVERGDKEHETIGIKEYQSAKLNPNAAKKESEDPYVYITNTGKKYHRKGCGYLKQSEEKIRLSEAKRRRYKPCSRCKPPR